MLNVFKRFKCALRCFKCFRRLKGGFRRLRRGPRLSLHTHSSCLLADPLYAQTIREKLVTQSFDHLQSIHSRCSDTEVCLVDVSRLLTWSSECKRLRGRPLFFLFQVLTATKGGDLEQRRGSPCYACLSYARSTICSTGGNIYNKNDLYLNYNRQKKVIMTDFEG